MDKDRLISLIRERRSCLCVGLDSDPLKLPEFLDKDVLAFNKAIIDATAPYCAAFKINTAFYEAMGPEGWNILQDTIEYIGDQHFVIADAKRGDIGNTAEQYAQAFFNILKADALTINPYMGKDSLTPYLKYKGKWSILLACTSNQGAKDFQKKNIGDRLLYEEVVAQSVNWASSEQLMFVVGATQVEELKKVRQLAPEYFFLVPGVGSQGGTVADVMKTAGTEDVGVLINASRSIIFAGKGKEFANAAARAAKELHQEMKPFISQ